MRFPRALAAAVTVLVATDPARAGELYKITSTDGVKTTEYTVHFGGGRRFEMSTAFDPKSKTFVYLRRANGTPAPAPAATVWDHRTGDTIRLYKFPGVEQPLPVIPSLDDMKVCPLTGDKAFQVDVKAVVD